MEVLLVLLCFSLSQLPSVYPGNDTTVLCLLPSLSLLTIYIDCLNGDIRLLTTRTNEGVVQLCHNRNWRTICKEKNDEWNTHAGNLACAQLGYKNEGNQVLKKASRY